MTCQKTVPIQTFSNTRKPVTNWKKGDSQEPSCTPGSSQPGKEWNQEATAKVCKPTKSKAVLIDPCYGFMVLGLFCRASHRWAMDSSSNASEDSEVRGMCRDLLHIESPDITMLVQQWGTKPMNHEHESWTWRVLKRCVWNARPKPKAFDSRLQSSPKPVKWFFG